jgi:hypothetical protein
MGRIIKKQTHESTGIHPSRVRESNAHAEPFGAHSETQTQQTMRLSETQDTRFEKNVL